MSKPTVVCTITARGGGSTFYRKNLYPLLGKPVIAWAIDALKATDFLTEIVVWSEDAEILSIAQKMGVCAIERPKDMVHYYAGFKSQEECYIERMRQTGAILGGKNIEYQVGFNCNYVLFRPETMNAMYAQLVAAKDHASMIQAVYRVEPGLCIVNPSTGGLFPFWNDPTRSKLEHPPLYRIAGMTIGHPVRCADSAYRPIYYEISRVEGLDFQSEDDIIPAEFHLSRRLRCVKEGECA